MGAECVNGCMSWPCRCHLKHNREARMDDTIVEAIQAHLQGFGLILFPGSPTDPPEVISDLKLMYLQPRKFPIANPDGPIFEYKRNTPLCLWELQIATDPRANNSTSKQTPPGD